MVELKVPSQVKDRPFEGMIVYDDSTREKRPVVFMQPDWKGVCADTVAQAHAVAGKDYGCPRPSPTRCDAQAQPRFSVPPVCLVGAIIKRRTVPGSDRRQRSPPMSGIGGRFASDFADRM
jgi:hypothetical protein